MRTLADELRKINATPASAELTPTTSLLRGASSINVEKFHAAIEEENLLAALFGGHNCERCSISFLAKTCQLIGCPACVLRNYAEAQTDGGQHRADVSEPGN